ncbi:MAG: hypothetical protein MUO50_12300 [Longimicrobiales bacterium]|jgi:hypothetical protein|nr:hypothetical protein [Longimicrobiales bacterium]
MPVSGSFPLADVLSSFSSVIVLLLVGALFLVFWQVAILLGAVIANLLRREAPEDAGHFEVG